MQPTTAAPAEPTTSADALTQLQQYQGSLQTPQDALNAAKTTLGVSGAQQTATGLQGAIQNTTNLLGQVAPSVYGRTGNSLVTTAQAGQQINNAEAPLNTQLNSENTDYTNAEKNYEDLLGQAEDQANGTLSQQATKESSLESIYNDLYGKESDAAKLAEQEREADQSASSAADVARITAGSGAIPTTDTTPTGSAGGALTGGSAGAAGKTPEQAQAAVHSLLTTNNANTIINTYNSIAASAKAGSTYDQAKLQLLEAAAPGLFKNGQLNTTYIQNTLGKGIKLF